MFQKLCSFSILMLFPIFLLAHGSHGNGIMAGFTHPIFGIDHLVAIFGTGLLGYLINPSKWYLQLMTFVLLMILGGVLGINKEATFIIEKIIAFSVFFIGILIAFGIELNLVVSLIILGVFGFVHGYAHGAEMEPTNTALKYISGYSLGTILVGVVGMYVGKMLGSKNQEEKYISILGGVICGCGIMMLLA